MQKIILILVAVMLLGSCTTPTSKEVSKSVEDEITVCAVDEECGFMDSETAFKCSLGCCEDRRGGLLDERYKAVNLKKFDGVQEKWLNDQCGENARVTRVDTCQMV